MADLKNLYNLLSQKYDAGSYDNFLENLNNQGGMKDVYDKLSGEYEMPDFDSFARKLTDRMQGYGQHSTTPNVNLSQQISNRLSSNNAAIDEDNKQYKGADFDMGAMGGLNPEANIANSLIKGFNGKNEKTANLRSTNNLLQQAKDITDKSNYENGHNVLQKAGYSFKKGFNKSMLTNGMSDTIDLNNIITVADKAEKNGYDNLSKDEKDLLDAFAIKSAAEQADKSGLTQRVFGSLPSQIPYMLQYGLTSGFGNIANTALKKAVTTAAKKMLGKEISGKVAGTIGKIASKNLVTKGMLEKYPELAGKVTIGNAVGTIADQAVRAAAMTPIQPTFYQDIEQNKAGNAEPMLNGNTIQYGGREGAMDTGKAIKDAFLTNFDANMSEMGGEIYAPILNVAKKSIALKSPLMGGFLNALGKISNNKAAKNVNKFTGFQGMIPEYIEEVQNNIQDAINTKGMTWKDVIDPEQNLETFLTVSATSVGMGMLNLGGAGMNAMQKRNIRRKYDAAHTNFLQTFGNTSEATTFAQNIANNSPKNNAELFTRMINSDVYSNDELQATQNYMLRSTQYGAMIGSVRDKMNEAKQKAEKEVRDNSNPDMGQLVTVQLDDNDTEGHTVVGGKIVMNEDGTIDAANSDEMITIKDDEGVRKAIDINKIQSVLETKPTEDAVKEATGSAEQQTAEDEASQMEDPTVEIGDTVQVGDRTGMVQARTPEGRPIVQYEDGTSEDVSPSNIQVIQSNEEEQQQEQQSEEQQKQQSLEELTSTLPKDKDGNIAFDQLNYQQAFQYTSLTDGSETAIADLQNDISQKTKEAEKINKAIGNATGGKRIQLREQLKALQNEINESNQFLQSQQPTQQSNVSQQAVTKQPEQQPIQPQQNEAIPAQAEQVSIQQEQPKQVPTAAKTNNVSQNMAKNATIPPIEESKVSKTMPAKVESEKVIKIRERKPRAARYAKEDAALGEPNSLREDLLRNIATGAIKFKWGNSTSGTKGLGAHLGLSTKEMRKYIPFLNNSEGNYPEVAAQKYLENTDYHFGEYTDQDIFNEILDIMQSYNSPRKMMDDAIKMHGDNDLNKTEEEYYKQQEEKYNYEIAEANHMTVEEYNSFLESLQKDLELDSKSDYEISGILADELNEQERLELEEQDEILKQYRDEQNRRTDEVQTGLSEESGKEGSNSEVDRLRTESRNNNEGTVETSNVERKNETGRSDNESSGSVSSERVQPYEPTTKEGRDRAKELDGQISNLKSQLEEDRKKYHEAENNFYSANGLFGSSVDEGMFTGTKDTSKENHDQTLKSYKNAIDASKRELDEAVSNRDKLVKTADEEAKRQTEIKPEDDGIRFRENTLPENQNDEEKYNSKEEQSIIEKAKADGTYMKAPNGKDSNLNERQWVQVRTKSFKNWFGDWEKAVQIEKLKISKPIEITGEEVEPSDDLKQYKKNALEYGKKLRGEYTNKDTGKKILLSSGNKNGGIKEVLQHDIQDKVHLQSIAAIPAIIENSIYIDSIDNEDTDKNPNVSKYYYYVCGLKINGIDYTVRATIAEQPNGERYYDHKLTEIEKGKLINELATNSASSGLSSIGEQGDTEQSNPATENRETIESPISNHKDKRLLSILQTNSSKIADENGEPLVVYHGSKNAGFTIFDDTKIGKNSDSPESTYWFSDNDRALSYSGTRNNVRLSNEENGNYAVFLNIKNPRIVDMEGATWEGDLTGKYEMYDTSESEEWNNPVYKEDGSKYFDSSEEAKKYAKDHGIKKYDIHEDPYFGQSVNDIAQDAIDDTENDGVIIHNVIDNGRFGSDEASDDYVAFSPNQIKSATDNNGEFSSSNDDIRFRVENNPELEKVNETFNTELDEFDKGTHKGELHLGTPSDVLLASGINSSEIYITQKTLKQHLQKHGLKVDDLRDLPKNLEKPLMVYEWGEKAKSLIVITNISTNDGRKITVAVKLERNGKRLEVNELASVHGKDVERMLNDMTIREKDFGKNKLKYVNKNKTVDWLGLVPPKGTASLTDQQLRATKIINEFQNPTLDEGKIISSIEDLSEKLNTPVRIIRSTDEINDSNSTRQRRKRHSKGWYNSKTGEITIILPNAENETDAEKTVLHEIVGHKGLRGMLGNKFDAMLDMVFKSLPEEQRKELAQEAYNRYKGDVRVATEEYLARMAEKDAPPSLVKRIVAKVREFFRSIGIDLKMDDNDITYMLWKSKNRLMNGDTPEIAARKAKADEEIRYRDEIPERDSFDKDVNTLAFKLKENYQDRMLSLKVLIKKVEEITGSVVKDFENALLSENVLTSKSKIENEIFMDKFMVPVFKAVHDLGDIGNTINYMMFKHGLERNEVFAKRDADKWRERAISTLDKTSSDYDNNIKAIDNRYSDILAKNMEKDYSGIKKLEEELGVTAIDYVDSFEKAHDTKNLWNTVNAATKETLRKQYESGMMNKSTYEKVKGMFNYYIPLRGFKEETAEDLYGEMYSSKGKMFSSGMKPAKGRGSIADSPIAYIGQMGAQAIISGNKNLMKQHFLRMCLNHPTKLYSVNPVWIVNIGTKDNPEWKEQAPEYNEDADTYDQNVKDFNKRMNNLEAEGMAYKGHPNLKLGMFITKYDADEHEIKVYSNGTPYIIYINANPKVAQAVNGTNNPDANYNGIMKSIMWCNRNMAANFTMRNPAFVLSNFSRDIIYANTRLFVKEGSAYALAFDANYKKSFGALRRFIYGTPDMAKENDRMLQEFLLNGGETGYTASLNVDAYKKITKAEMRKLDGSVDPIKTFRILSRTFANFNRVFEDATRFACYMTSRGEGRSITRSIVDAKEVSVNFNRKGSRQGMLANVIAPMFIFFNAGVQGLDNFLSLFKDYPVKALSAFLAWGALGYLINMMCSGGDNDDYDNLSDWLKWNNVCVPLGDHKFLYIPLSIEVRAFYGMGVILHSWQSGKMENENVFGNILSRFLEILPINPLGSISEMSDLTDKKNLINIAPSATQPFFQAISNRDWTGKPIYKDKDNEYLPNWRKAYAGTSDFAINSAELINSLTGGDFATKGDVDINPAIVEYLFEQYTGGLGKTIDESIKTLSSAIHKAANEGEMYWKNAPVINRFFSDSKEYESTGKLNEKYFKMIDFMKGIESRESQYKKGLKNVEFNTEAASKIGKFYSSSDYRRYKVIKLYSTMIGKMKKEEAMANDNQDKQLHRKENELKINMLNKLDEIK